MQTPEILDHDLNQYFPELLKFESIEETEKSDVYQKIKPTVERILNAVVQENFSDANLTDEDAETRRHGDAETARPKTKAQKPKTVSAIAWNIERGNILRELLTH